MRIQRTLDSWLKFALAAWVGCLSAEAAVLIHLSLEEMTQQSSAIVLGRCVEVRSAWNADRSNIVTHNVFEVRQYYKGSLGQRITITEPGGQVGDLVAEYSGVPRFEVGEEAVLFVWTDPRGRHQVIGLTQGKFRMGRDGATGAAVLQQTLSAEPMLEPTAHSHTGPAARMVMPLATLRSRVESYLRNRAGGARQ
ncbi:MAG: hypothetical protein ACRD88_14385 [Terriglobia bacterium]